MRSLLSKAEAFLLAVCGLLLAAAVWGPAASQPAHYHAFADTRTLWGIPFAMDVLSNLPFALAGFAGAWVLARVPRGGIANVERAMAGLFFAGLVFTALASGVYHWRPDDAGLAIDRLGMSVAFAGLLGLAAATCISERAGAVLGLALLVAAPAAAQHAFTTGNVMPWALLQGGGMVLVLACALVRRRPCTLDVRWLAVIAAYGIAKVLELNDHLVYELTAHWVSGHTLKHVVAALAAVPVVSAIGRRSVSTQNAAEQAQGRRLPARQA